jgi:hypothetical protein
MPLISTYSSMSYRGWFAGTLPASNVWVQTQKLTANDGFFGFSVALNSTANTSIIAAPYEDIAGNTNQGAAYAYSFDGSSWALQQKLLSGDPGQNELFGSDVAINEFGNIAIIGSINDNTGVANGAAYIFTYNGTTWTQQQKLTANDASSLDFFGEKVAINSVGNVVIIGASYDDIGANSNQGSAYVFTYNGTTWTQQQKLTASDGAAGDRFGDSVAFNGIGNIAIIGASEVNIGANIDQGSAYVFTYDGTTWSQQQKLTASDGAAGDNFGVSVAINKFGNIAIIGAWEDDIGANSNQGSAYIFTYNGTTWTEQQKLIANDGAAGDSFGQSVTINDDGNIVLIGAYQDDIGFVLNQGSAYVFTYDGTTWTQQQKLTANDGASGDSFGSSVSLNNAGNIALIGAQYTKNGTPFLNGAAYIFRSN